VTLGWKEKDDLQCVIQHLRASGRVSTIGLWGRSMGAVTAILYGCRDPNLSGIVLDSPFANFKTLSLEIASTHTKMPKFAASIAYRFIRKSVKKRAKVDIYKLKPINEAKKCRIPALFVVAKEDDFVRPHHGESLFREYGGDKKFLRVEGDHNSVRPTHMLSSVGLFFQSMLGADKLPAFNENLLGETPPIPTLEEALLEYQNAPKGV